MDRNTIKKNIISGLKEIHNWNQLDYGHTGQLMMDTDTGEVWTNSFHDEHTYITYHSDSIQSIPFGIIECHLQEGGTPPRRRAGIRPGGV